MFPLGTKKLIGARADGGDKGVGMWGGRQEAGGGGAPKCQDKSRPTIKKGASDLLPQCVFV